MIFACFPNEKNRLTNSDIRENGVAALAHELPIGGCRRLLRRGRLRRSFEADGRCLAFKRLHPAVIDWRDRAENTVPKGEIVRVVVIEFGVMLVVIGRAQQRPRIARRRRGKILEPRMPEGAVDLVEQPVRQQDQRRKRHQEDNDGVIALRQGRIHETDRIVAPHGRGDTSMMQQVIFVEQLGVQQPVREVEPGVEQHHAEQEEWYRRPPAEGPGREQCPALILGKETDRDGCAGHEDRRHALTDLNRLSLLPPASLLDAPLRIAIIEPGDAVAERKINEHRRGVDDRKNGEKSQGTLDERVQVEIRCCCVGNNQTR